LFVEAKREGNVADRLGAVTEKVAGFVADSRRSMMARSSRRYFSAKYLGGNSKSVWPMNASSDSKP
jgi:hypothetical protein